MRSPEYALGVVDRRVKYRDVTIPDVVGELHDPSMTVANELRLTRAGAGEELRHVALALRKLSVGPLAGMFDGVTSLGQPAASR